MNVESASRAPTHALGTLTGRTSAGLTALLAISAAAVSIRVSQASGGLSYLTESTISTVVGLVAGWSLVAVGLETVRRQRRQRLGYLIAAAGIAWFLPEWSDPAIGVALAFTIGLAFAWLYPCLVGHALFAAVGTSRPERFDAVIAMGYAIFVLGLGVLPALAFDPRTAGCGSCPPNFLGIPGGSGLFDDAAHVASVLGAAWSVGSALLLGTTLAQSGSAVRRGLAPIVVPGIIFLVLVAIALGRAIVDAVPSTDPMDRLLRLGQALALAAMAIGVASEWFRARRARARVAQVVADLAGSPPLGGLRDHLAIILRDSELQLGYPTANGLLVDARGRPVDAGPRPGRMTTPIVREGSVVAVIDHDRDVLEDADEIEEVIAVARLGLEHERLQANSRAQLDALRAARRRIVEAGDAHRKELERGLHDGAQQHLIALSLQIRFLDRDAETGTWIGNATAELRLAMDDLRDVAHGIYPTVVSDEGFAAAIDALAEASSVPLSIVEMVEERFDPAIEVAAYHVVAEAVRTAVGPIRIRAWRTGDRLTIEVMAAAIPARIEDDVADRVGAVDGTLELVRDEAASTTRMTAEIPCGPQSASA